MDGLIHLGQSVILLFDLVPEVQVLRTCEVSHSVAHVQWKDAASDGSVTAVLEVNFLKFQNLGFLSVHLCREDEDGMPDEEGPAICVQGLRLVGKQ